jgi:hypothetical protein
MPASSSTPEPIRPWGALRPDQKYRGYGGQFPADEQRHQIARQHRAQRRARIQQSRHLLHRIAQVPGINNRQQRGDVENEGEGEAQPVESQRGQGQAEKFDLSVLAIGQTPKLDQAQHRQRQQEAVPDETLRRQQRQQRTANQNQRRVETVNHRSNPRPVSPTSASAWPAAPAPRSRQNRTRRRTRTSSRTRN